jgi:hypothetical protein
MCNLSDMQQLASDYLSLRTIRRLKEFFVCSLSIFLLKRNNCATREREYLDAMDKIIRDCRLAVVSNNPVRRPCVLVHQQQRGGLVVRGKYRTARLFSGFLKIGSAHGACQGHR